MNTTAPKLELQTDAYSVDEVLRHNPKNNEVERNFVIYFDSVFLARTRTMEQVEKVCGSHANTHGIRFSLTEFRDRVTNAFA